jgi:anti-anti-sigma factor
MGSSMTVNSARTGPACTTSTAHLDRGGVRLSTHNENAATVVAATGEIDASNVDRLTEYTRRILSEDVEDRPLVLDLSQLSFIGTQGIPALFTLGEECGKAGVGWAVVVGHPVERLLRIGDSDHRLPTARSLSQALQRLTTPTPARRLLQLVTKSG